MSVGAAVFGTAGTGDIHQPGAAPRIGRSHIECGQREFDLNRPEVLSLIHRTVPYRLKGIRLDITALGVEQRCSLSLKGNSKLIEIEGVIGRRQENLHIVTSPDRQLRVEPCNKSHLRLMTLNTYVNPILTGQNFKLCLSGCQRAASYLAASKAGMDLQFVPYGFIHTTVQGNAILVVKLHFHFLLSDGFILQKPSPPGFGRCMLFSGNAKFIIADNPNITIAFSKICIEKSGHTEVCPDKH